MTGYVVRVVPPGRGAYSAEWGYVQAAGSKPFATAARAMEVASAWCAANPGWQTVVLPADAVPEVSR